MSPPAALLASLEAASTREELLRACQRVCASTGVRSALLSAPPFFNFVTKAVRATDPSDPELADAVEELLKYTHTGLEEVSAPPPGYGSLDLGDPRLERSLLGLIGAIVDSAKWPNPLVCITSLDFLRAAVGLLRSSPNTEGLIELARLLLRLDSSLWSLHDRGALVPRESLACCWPCLLAADLTREHSRNPEECPGPTAALLGSLLRHAASLIDSRRLVPSRAGYSDMLERIACAICRTSDGMERAGAGPEACSPPLELRLPGHCRADVARSLGLYVAAREAGRGWQLQAPSSHRKGDPVFQGAAHPCRWIHLGPGLPDPPPPSGRAKLTGVPTGAASAAA